MARSTAQRLLDFGVVGRIHQVHHRVPLHRMAQAVLDWQPRNLAEVVLGQPHLAVENRHGVFGLKPLRLSVRAVAFKAKIVDFRCAEQVCIVATVWGMTGCASLPERRLVHVLFLALLGLVGVAVQADIDRIRLRETLRLARVGTVTIDAITRRAGVLDFCLLDLLGLLRVATDAQLFSSGLCEDDLAVFRGLVARRAGFLSALERRVHESLHELRAR